MLFECPQMIEHSSSTLELEFCRSMARPAVPPPVSLWARVFSWPDMLDELTVSRLLDGFRGGEPADRKALIDAICGLSKFFLEHRPWLADLEINPLKICWSDYQAGENAVGAADPLREYYLDLSNLQRTSERDVDELLASFWVRFQREDQREDALAILGLSDPVDDTTIKQTYRQLAMQHHPDRGGETERLQAINAAVKVLLKTG